MKLYHGTYEKVAPIIKIGEFAMSGNNVFDGLFASPERDIAASHGNTVFIYHVDDDKIANPVILMLIFKRFMPSYITNWILLT
ncbi:hypothetical protein ACLB1E_35910 [Escherichia coli]